MVEVADVVDEHEAEGDAFVSVVPDVGEAGGVGVLDGVGEVTVEREPEGDGRRATDDGRLLTADRLLLPAACHLPTFH